MYSLYSVINHDHIQLHDEDGTAMDYGIPAAARVICEAANAADVAAVEAETFKARAA